MFSIFANQELSSLPQKHEKNGLAFCCCYSKAAVFKVSKIMLSNMMNIKKEKVKKIIILKTYFEFPVQVEVGIREKLFLNTYSLSLFTV